MHPFFYSTRWHSNRYIRGAYSYISTDCDINGTSSRQLAEPITLKHLNSIDNDDYSKVHAATPTIQNENSKNINNQKNMSINEESTCPILLFAGEACHDQYFSTAHGAFLSGIEQAAKIVPFYE